MGIFKRKTAEEHLVKAEAHYEAGRHADAIAACKKAIAIKPDHASAYFIMGEAYHRLKQYSDAIATYKRYVALEPTGELTNLARDRISEMAKKIGHE